ncbi:MAG: hypothetical protein ACTSP3_00030 [Candidatus Heimdallarchaeaceae archaeon]
MSKYSFYETVDQIVKSTDKQAIFDQLNEIREIVNLENSMNLKMIQLLELLQLETEDSRLELFDLIDEEKLKKFLELLNSFSSNLEAIIIKPRKINHDGIKKIKNDIYSIEQKLIAYRNEIFLEIKNKLQRKYTVILNDIERYLSLKIVLKESQVINALKTLKKDIIEKKNEVPLRSEISLIEKSIKSYLELSSRFYLASKVLDEELDAIFSSLSDSGKVILDRLILKGEKISYKDFIKHKEELAFLIEKEVLSITI